jgi:hypothetical protein
MHQPKPSFAHEVDSRQVLSRFAFRLIVLIVFASVSTRGFGPAFAALLALAALFCAIAGAMRREEMFGHVLTNWDEAVAYAVIARLASTLS